MATNFTALREQMVREQLAQRDITDQRVLTAMQNIPRHEFVPLELQDRAYQDNPLPIGLDQTISQPYMVAFMSQLLALKGDEVLLEIGTGSGYQTAILAKLAKFVYSIERHPHLAESAAQRLGQMGYTNVAVYVGDGTHGLKAKAPFDGILIAATGPHIPNPLKLQLAEGGKMILPVGKGEEQYLLRVWRHGDEWQVEKMMQVRFVPLVGRFGYAENPPKT